MLQIKDLTEQDTEKIEKGLEAYDDAHMPARLQGGVQIGAYVDGILAGGVNACMTAFRILYVSTVFVESEYRGRGIGRALMEETERRARQLGASLIRLDTFDWQGKAFYQALGYEVVGQYESREDGFSEFFFLKRL